MILTIFTHDFSRKHDVNLKFLKVFKYFSSFNSVFSKYGSYSIKKSLILPSKFVPIDRKKNYLCDNRSLDTITNDFKNHYVSNKNVLAELKNDFSFEPIGNIDFVISKSNFVTSIPSNSKPLIKDGRFFELLQSECHQHLDKHKFVLTQIKTNVHIEPKLNKYDKINYEFGFNTVRTEGGQNLSILDEKDGFIVDLVCHSKRAASFDLNSLGIDITDPMADFVVLATEVNHTASPYFWKSYPYEQYRLTDQNIMDNFIRLIHVKRDELILNPNGFKEQSYNIINKILDDADCNLYSKEDVFVTFDRAVNELYNFSFFHKNFPEIFQKDYIYKKPTTVTFHEVDLSLIKQKYSDILNNVYDINCNVTSNTSASELLKNFTTLCSDSDLQIFCNLAETALTHEFMLPLLLPHFILAITPPPYSDVYITANVYSSYLSLCEFGSIKEAFSIFRR